MKKLFTLCLVIICGLSVSAQYSTGKINLTNRPNDHFMIQIGYYGWATKPDTVSTKGIPRTFNMYFMYDFPFKTDPRFSIGAGIGLGSDNMYFNKMTIDITGSKGNTLGFQAVSDTNYFKKYKLA